MALRTFTNTRYLSEAANDYTKNKGIYIKAPKGSRDYNEYWAEQKRRCKEGFSVGDIKITGRHYFYLNFCPIKMTADDDDKDKAKGSWNVMKAKELLFPKFWEIDYNWWWAKEIAMFGMHEHEMKALQIEGLPVQDYTEGKHMSCLKTRRAGFSYKEAADGVWNYNFVPYSKSYFFAAKKEYLIVDGILNKVSTYIEHLNTNTQDFWRRNQMEKSTLMHQKASYIDTRKDVRGFQSEIIGVIIDDPDKVRGKDGIKITYEEAGSFRNLKEALAISMPSVKDGATMTGQISVFGTGGEEGPDIEGLEDIFLEPEAYDMLAFNNIWEEGQEETVCGYFVPCTMANRKFMDEDGNVDKVGALAFSEAQREKKRKLKDPKEVDRVTAEFPRNPSESLQRLSSNIFPVAEAQAQLRRVEKNMEIQATIMNGVIWQGQKGVQFEPKQDAKPITQFPHKNDDDLNGCITIYQAPDTDINGHVMPGVYFTVVDPYYKDQAEDRTSLWAAYIFKQKSMGDPYGETLVASVVMRPPQLTTAYRNTVLLTKMYNSTIQCEIAGGGQGFLDYLRVEKLMGLAEYQPLLFSTKEIISEKNRSYFMNTSTGDKATGLTYFAEWLLQQRGINHAGQPILNIHLIYDVALLREIIKFNPDPKKNFDRISAMSLAMYMLKEREINGSQIAQKIPEFYNRSLTGNPETGHVYANSSYSLDDMLE